MGLARAGTGLRKTSTVNVGENARSLVKVKLESDVLSAKSYEGTRNSLVARTCCAPPRCSQQSHDCGATRAREKAL